MAVKITKIQNRLSTCMKISKNQLKNIIMATVVHTQAPQAGERGKWKESESRIQGHPSLMRFKENLDYKRPFFKRKMRERKKRDTVVNSCSIIGNESKYKLQNHIVVEQTVILMSWVKHSITVTVELTISEKSLKYLHYITRSLRVNSVWESTFETFEQEFNMTTQFSQLKFLG